MDEDPQLSQLKTWWQNYGKFVIAGVLLVIVVLGVWQFWHHRQVKQAQNAARLYQQLIQAAEAEDSQTALTLASRIQQTYPTTVYFDLSGLIAARIQLQQAHLSEALNQLQAVVQKGHVQFYQDLARVNAGRIWNVQGAYKNTVTTLEQVQDPELQKWAALVRSEAYRQLGEKAKAAQLYQWAQKKLGADALFIRLSGSEDR